MVQFGVLYSLILQLGLMDKKVYKKINLQIDDGMGSEG